MITLYLKDIDISTPPPDIAMFYRMAAFANGTNGARPRRLLFDNEPRIEQFKAAFPEIVPYLTREADGQ